MHYGSLRSTMARYAGHMKRRCNYCWEPADKLKIIMIIERQSGPPFVKRACTPCVTAKKLEPVQ